MGLLLEVVYFSCYTEHEFVGLILTPTDSFDYQSLFLRSERALSECHRTWKICPDHVGSNACCYSLRLISHFLNISPTRRRFRHRRFTPFHLMTLVLKYSPLQKSILVTPAAKISI